MTPEQLAAALITPRKRRHMPEPAGIGTLALHWHADRASPQRVLLIHGWDADHRDMLPLAQSLAERGVCSVMPDLPAHGLSPGASTTIPEAAAAIRQAAAGHGPFALAIGHSIGAAVLLHAVRDGLDTEALVLLAPPRNYVAELTVQARAAGAPPPLVEAALAVLRQRTPSLDEVDSVSMAPAVRQPALVISAGQDRVLDPAHGAALATALDQGSLLMIEDANHRSVLTSEAVHAAVLSQIARLGAHAPAAGIIA